MNETWWQIAIDIAQIVAGGAAAVALIQTVAFRRHEAAAKDRDLAEQVTAWAVTEGETTPGTDDEFLGGVVIRNGTPNTISVKVKTGRRQQLDREKFDDDGFKGQSFNVIPHGVYYTQHYTEKGKKLWSAPKPVDTASGKFVIDLSSGDAEGDQRSVTLVPVSVMPEPKAVTLFEFEVAGKHWQRVIGAGLLPLKHKAAASQQHSEVQKEFKESEQQNLEQPKQRQDHDVDSRVQTVFTEVAQYLTGRPLTAEELVRNPVEVAARFRDVFATVKLSGKRQNVKLGLPGRDTEIYFAGNGKGEIPTGSEHDPRPTTACALKTAKFRSSLKPAAGSGAELAEALVVALRALGEHGGVCSCGTPFVFLND